jgi:hypothetical protein
VRYMDFHAKMFFGTPCIALILMCTLLSVVASTPEKPTPAQFSKENGERPDAAVRTQMCNVNFHFTDNVAVQIKSLNGALVPIGDHEFPIMEDKDSFKIHIDSAEVSISPADLSNDLNSYVFARPNTPLMGISISIAHGQLHIKGKLHDKGDIPFETIGTLSATPDGKVRLHAEKVKALHVPVKGLMDAFGVEINDLIKNGKVPGVHAEENDLILDLELILPPPHLQGRVTSVRIVGNAIAETFGNSEKKPMERLRKGNYMSYQGNRLRFGKLTMNDTDLMLVDLDPKDPLDFYLDHYKDQVAAGYTKISTGFQLRAYVKDFEKLDKTGLPTQDTQHKSN